MILKNHKGEDLILYRGECGDPDVNGVRSKLPSIYFSDVDVANIYALESHSLGAPRLYPVKLEIKSLFINQPTDAFLEVAHLVQVFGWSRAHRFVEKHADLIEQTDHWRELQVKDPSLVSVKAYLDQWPKYPLTGLYFQAWPFFQDIENIQALIDFGFDGAIHAGSGYGSAGKTEYLVFSKEQIHYVLEGK